jgi:heat shock protein HtpX
MKRTVLFVLANLAVLLVLSIAANLLGFDRFLSAQGLDLWALLGFCAVFGMGGSVISLLLSKQMALRATGAAVIGEPRGDAEAWLVQTVAHQAQAAGIAMPQVAVFPSDAPNAFATGARRDGALVAVSTGLLRQMRRDEVEAVLGHEISHVANGDMVTLALIQGVVNTFVLFLSRLVGYWVDRVLLRGDREDEGPVHGPGFFLTTMVAQILFGIAASLIVMWFSRQREFRADAGGARLAGREKMIAALERLRAATDAQPLPDAMAAFGISGRSSGISRLFLTHPPLEERIERLRRGEL